MVTSAIASRASWRTNAIESVGAIRCTCNCARLALWSARGGNLSLRLSGPADLKRRTPRSDRRSQLHLPLVVSMERQEPQKSAVSAFHNIIAADFALYPGYSP